MKASAKFSITKTLLLLVACLFPVTGKAQNVGEKKVETKADSAASEKEQPKQEKKGSQVDLWLTQKVYRANRFFSENVLTPPGESKAFESTFSPYIIDLIKENVATNAWDDSRIRLDICNGDLVVTQTENVHKKLEEFLTKTITENRRTQIIFDWQVIVIEMRDAPNLLEKLLPPITTQTRVFPWIGDPVTVDTGSYYTLTKPTQKSHRDGWMRMDISSKQIKALSSELKKSKRAKIACNVHLTTINGKVASYDLSRRVDFVSHYNKVEKGGFVPAVGEVRTGMWFEMCGFSNEDKTSATIYFQPTLCNLLATDTIKAKATIEYLTKEGGKSRVQDMPVQIPILATRTGVLKAKLRNKESLLAIGLSSSIAKDKKFKTRLILILLTIGIAPGNL